MLGLAVNACSERNGYEEERERIAALLSCARDLWRTFPEAEADADRIELGRLTFRLVHLADILAVTTSE